MKITKSQLKQIIKEELAGVLGEDNDWSVVDDMFAQDAKEREAEKKKKGIPTSIKTSPSVAPEIPGAPKKKLGEKKFPDLTLNVLASLGGIMISSIFFKYFLALWRTSKLSDSKFSLG